MGCQIPFESTQHFKEGIVPLISRGSNMDLTLGKIIKLGLQSIHNCGKNPKNHRETTSYPLSLFHTENGSKSPFELISYGIEF